MLRDPLHALGHDVHVQAAGHADDRGDDGRVTGIGGDGADERAVDLEHDDADHRAGRKIAPPTLALWGRSNVGQLYGDVLTIWREAASTVSGGAVESGHYPAEEAPDVVLEAFERFFV